MLRDLIFKDLNVFIVVLVFFSVFRRINTFVLWVVGAAYNFFLFIVMIEDKAIPEKIGKYWINTCWPRHSMRLISYPFMFLSIREKFHSDEYLCLKHILIFPVTLCLYIHIFKISFFGAPQIHFRVNFERYVNFLTSQSILIFFFSWFYEFSLQFPLLHRKPVQFRAQHVIK